LLARSHLLNALRRRRQVLRHCSAHLLNCLAHLAPDVVMRLVGSILALDALTTQLGFRLGRTEEVRRQLLTAHVIEDVLSLAESFAPMDIASPLATVEPHVAVVLKDREVPRGEHTGVASGGGEGLVVLGQLVAYIESTLILGESS